MRGRAQPRNDLDLDNDGMRYTYVRLVPLRMEEGISSNPVLSTGLYVKLQQIEVMILIFPYKMGPALHILINISSSTGTVPAGNR
jgi:hypothetical protein